MPPNANLFQPGPAFIYVVINGVPSNGTMVIIGNGQIGPQTLDKSVVSLPASTNSTKATSSSNGNSNQSQSGGNTGGTAGIVAPSTSFITVIGMLGAAAFGATLF
jgi:hypothetical protein